MKDALKPANERKHTSVKRPSAPGSNARDIERWEPGFLFELEELPEENDELITDYFQEEVKHYV